MIIEIGTALRYKGLGAGRVRSCDERTFKGSPRTFAVIHFEHRDMVAQIPLGDPAVEHKISNVLSASEVEALVDLIPTEGGKMLRTYDERERVGLQRLREGGPRDWAELLRDYALGQRERLRVAASDVEIIREAKDMLAAEWSCASEETTFDAALARITEVYASCSIPLPEDEIAAEES